MTASRSAVPPVLLSERDGGATMRCCALALALLGIVATASPLEDSGTANTVERELQDQGCPTICAEGVSMNSPDKMLSLGVDIQGSNQHSCGTVASWLAAEDAVVCGVVEAWVAVVDLAAYCGCEGSAPPNLCQACPGGGAIEDPARVVTSALLGTSYTCQEGAELTSYLKNTVACNTFTATYEPACCGQASPSTGPPGPTSTAPSPAASPTATPTSSSNSSPTAAPVPSSVVPSNGPSQPAIPTAPPPTAVSTRAPALASPSTRAPSQSPPTGGTSGSTSRKIGLALYTSALLLLNLVIAP